MDNDWMNKVKKNGFMSVSIEYHCEELDKVLEDIYLSWYAIEN